MLNKSICKGFWSLICYSENESFPDSIEIQSMLESLRKVQKEYPELFPLPPEATEFKKDDCVQILTSNCTDEEIRKSAEIIRRNIDHPFSIYYYKITCFEPLYTVLKFMYTPEGELYNFIDNKKRTSSSSTSFWLHISTKDKLYDIPKDFLPSLVTDRDHIHLPIRDEDFETVNSDKGGKWMLYFSDMKTLDSSWKKLIRLYEKGILVALKTSTARFSVSENFPNYQTKAIMCYTADASCKSCVKRAGDCISVRTGYDAIMYYKSNKASLHGHYRHEGHGNVSMYMFTVTCEMLERDYLGRWKTITYNESEDEKSHM